MLSRLLPRRRTPVVSVVVVSIMLAVVGSGCAGDADVVGSVGVADTPPPWRSWIVTPSTSGAAPVVLDAPGGEPLQLDTDGDGTARAVTLADPLPSGAPLTLLARQLDVEAGGERWHEVYLPVRPNGSTGWVADDDVTVTHTDLAVRIRLGARRLEVVDEGRLVGSFEVAIGTAETPTPTGTYFLKELLAPTDPTGAYGPLAYGLSGFSPAILDAEEFAEGVIGVHGTNQPELIGQAVSHGCVRLRNADIEQLRGYELPLGTPVVIEA